jgi:hypothetical protein
VEPLRGRDLLNGISTLIKRSLRELVFSFHDEDTYKATSMRIRTSSDAGSTDSFTLELLLSKTL